MLKIQGNNSYYHIYSETVLQFIIVIYTNTNRNKKILYDQYCMNLKQGEGEFQGTLLSRSWSPTDSFFQASPLPSLDHNPSYPGAGQPPPQHPGLWDNGTLGVAWVIYRIIM